MLEQNTLNENIFTECCHFQHHRHYTAEKSDSQQSLKTPVFKLSAKWLLRSQGHHKRVHIPAFRCWHHLYGKWWSKTQKVSSSERGELTCYTNRQKKICKSHVMTLPKASSMQDVRKDIHGDSHTKGKNKQLPHFRHSLDMPTHIQGIYCLLVSIQYTRKYIFLSFNWHPISPFKMYPESLLYYPSTLLIWKHFTKSYYLIVPSFLIKWKYHDHISHLVSAYSFVASDALLYEWLELTQKKLGFSASKSSLTHMLQRQILLN